MRSFSLPCIYFVMAVVQYQGDCFFPSPVLKCAVCLKRLKVVIIVLITSHFWSRVFLASYLCLSTALEKTHRLWRVGVTLSGLGSSVPRAIVATVRSQQDPADLLYFALKDVISVSE